ncbi:MAG: glycosyltransferase family 4 protein [Verrucomicrobia bacterium]|nr:glycosyltransferase family 4 protein [Verrucomicrobiota bacterium]
MNEIIQEIGAGRFEEALERLLPLPESSYDLSQVSDPLFSYLVNFLDAAAFETEENYQYTQKIVNYFLPQLQIPDRKGIPLDPRLEGSTICELLGSTQRRLNLTYHLEAKPLQPFEGTPLVFLEPASSGLTHFLQTFSGKKALFVFETKMSLCNMLQFPEVVTTLLEPEHAVFIMELYPKDEKIFEFTSLQPAFVADRPILQSYVPALIQALQSANSDWLYRVCKRALYALNEQRLGKMRAAALWQKSCDFAWYDPYKTLAPKEASLGPEPQDLFGVRLRELGEGHQKRKVGAKQKLKLAHVVPQLIDGGHAPSKLVDSLIRYHDQERFELFVLSTERLDFHPSEYPIQYVYAGSSIERAPQLLDRWPKEGVQVYVSPGMASYEQTAKNIAAILHEREIDICLFHGPDVINTMCARMCDVPLTALFEHGTPPTHASVDIAITSSDEALQIYADLYEKLGIKPYAVPYAVDCRASWKREPPTKEELGLPEESFVLTTISNHLEHRLGVEVCEAIAKILQRCPSAVYAPMGKVADPVNLEKFFAKAGVASQVFFLGQKPAPSHYARACKLYLNEFPFGSGLGILDAMAAGCPVVSMYDEHGPQQARYGGVYFGLDKVVRSNSVDDYVELACSLIENPTMYKEWREVALERYRLFSDIRGYVQKIEGILLLGSEVEKTT